MKAILCSQYCQPDDLVLADVPDPVAGPNEAVIVIKSAALNFFDILMIQGKYQIKPPFPFSPAAEVAGVIESVGPGVTDLKVGDRVAASCGHNGAREKIALPANSIELAGSAIFSRAPLWPQDAATRSPTLRSVTPGPTLSITPATSAAGENGNGGLIWYLPWIIRMSKKFSAADLITMTASLGPATGSGTSVSTRSSGPQYCVQRMAFMDTPEFRTHKGAL